MNGFPRLWLISQNYNTDGSGNSTYKYDAKALRMNDIIFDIS